VSSRHVSDQSAMYSFSVDPEIPFPDDSGERAKQAVNSKKRAWRVDRKEPVRQLRSRAANRSGGRFSAISRQAAKLPSHTFSARGRYQQGRPQPTAGAVGDTEWEQAVACDAKVHPFFPDI